MKIPIDPLKLAPFVAGLFKLWAGTIRFKIHGDWQSVFERNEGGEPFVITLWHGELFPVAAFGQSASTGFALLISQSKDGEFISRVLERLGQTTVRGSSSRGGLKALLQTCRVMEKENRMAVIAMDGPRGPRHKAKDGAIYLAQKSGAKIIPVRAYAKPKKVFGSWDKFILPMPFSRCDIYMGDFMEVTDEKLSKDVLAVEKLRLEKLMNNLGPVEENE